MHPGHSDKIQDIQTHVELLMEKGSCESGPVKGEVWVGHRERGGVSRVQQGEADAHEWVWNVDFIYCLLNVGCEYQGKIEKGFLESN